MSADAQAGFFGKLPGRGDFVGRRWPREFQDEWDNWLQHALASSRETLGERWLETYLASPIWRFVLGAGVCACGDATWAGVLMPSVDRVGRYFPLTIAVAQSSPCDPFVLACQGRDWFERAEELALSALDEDEDFDLDAFSEAVAGLGPASAGPAAPVDELRAAPWRLPLGAVNSPERDLLPLLGALVHAHEGPCSIWWSAGSELVAPSVLVSARLPPAQAYAALLDGQWEGSGWSSLLDRRELLA